MRKAFSILAFLGLCSISQAGEYPTLPADVSFGLFVPTGTGTSDTAPEFSAPAMGLSLALATPLDPSRTIYVGGNVGAYIVPGRPRGGHATLLATANYRLDLSSDFVFLPGVSAGVIASINNRLWENTFAALVNPRLECVLDGSYAIFVDPSVGFLGSNLGFLFRAGLRFEL